MCLIVFAYQYHPEFPVILAGNRDEFYNRPATGIHSWNTDPLIIAGKDKKAGGTWLGINEYGNFAAITNYRDLSNLKHQPPSRGELIPDFLQSMEHPETVLKRMEERAHLYNGFNLIAGSSESLFYLSNQGRNLQKIDPGVHVISNAFLNTPWPKSEWAVSEFKSILESGSLDEEELFEMLKNGKRYPLEMLPKTGLSEEMEKAVSSVFIQTDDYGTRSSAILTIDKNHQATFSERVYKPGTKETEHYKSMTQNLKPVRQNPL